MESDPRPGRVVAATVVRSNLTRDARERRVEDRYDVVLDVFVGRGDPVRVPLADVALGRMLPAIGSTVTVRVAGDGISMRPADVEILWRGDPNLDVDAHRRHLADLAQRAQRRRGAGTTD